VRDLKLLNTQVNGIEAINPGIVPGGEEFDAGIHARQTDAGAADGCARLV
jgi:hypothetical protein